MLKDTDIEADSRNDDFGYIHYSAAKREGIHIGSTFTPDGTTCFKAVEYVTWRPDINRRFAGFRLAIVA
jgi:hypothetical protein